MTDTEIVLAILQLRLMNTEDCWDTADGGSLYLWENNLDGYPYGNYVIHFYAGRGGDGFVRSEQYHTLLEACRDAAQKMGLTKSAGELGYLHEDDQRDSQGSS